MDSNELRRLRGFELTLAHHSDLYEIIEQRAASLGQQKFHWFVRLQSLLFVAEEVTRDNSTREEAEFIAFRLKNSLILLINENKPNYVGPLSSLIIHFFKVAPAAVYDVQTPFLFYLEENTPSDFLNVFSYFPVDGAALSEVIERADPEQICAILANVSTFCASNNGFTEHLATGKANPSIRELVERFEPEPEPVEEEEEVLDDGETVMLLKEAENLINFEEPPSTKEDIYDPGVSTYSQEIIQENEELKEKAMEYEETLKELSEDAPHSQIEQLQLEVAQTREAFDQLMIKYQSQKEYVEELQMRSGQYEEKLSQFKILFEQANERYEEMKRVANERIEELREGRGDTGELAAARAEIEKLRNEKAQLSDITKKLITKLNSK